MTMPLTASPMGRYEMGVFAARIHHDDDRADHRYGKRNPSCDDDGVYSQDERGREHAHGEHQRAAGLTLL